MSSLALSSRVPELGTNNASLLFSADRQFLFAGTWSGKVQAWSLSDRHLAHRWQLSAEPVTRLLADVGIDRKMAKHKPAELSGGQQQRVAVARALVNNPDILLCDEPTGNLDTKTGGQIMDMLADLNRQGRTIIIVTHDPLIGERAERIVRIKDGQVEAS